ncbi:cytochrome P460 family protein [Roseobacteraceae bacterium NS-SX3]
MIRKTIAACLALGLAGAAVAQDAAFGTDGDADDASALWQVMTEMNLAGEGMIHAFPYEGIEPHGMMLETFYTTATVNGHTGTLVVKRNYGPEGVGAAEVLADPGTHLAAVTVMFRREEGYDPDNQNWFWAKYLPDGSLDKNPKGMRLAGRVAKGMDAGCIACHSGQEDYLFTTDHITQ